MNNLYSNGKSTFNGYSVSTSNEDSHLIATDSSLMNKMGLFAFTTGTLYDWLHTTKDGNIIPFDHASLWQKAFDEVEDGEEKLSDMKSRMQALTAKYPNFRLFSHAYTSLPGVTPPEKSPPQLFFSLQNYLGYTREDDEEGCGTSTYINDGTSWSLQEQNCREGCFSEPPKDLTPPEENLIKSEGSVTRVVLCEKNPNFVNDTEVKQDTFNGYFTAWRNEGRTGRYIQYNVIDQSDDPSLWRFDEGEEKYVFSDLEIDFFHSALQLQQDGNIDLVGADRGIRFNRGSLYIDGRTTIVDGKKVVINDNPNISEMDYSLEPFVQGWVDTQDEFESYRFIQSLIEMNNYVNLLVAYKESKGIKYETWSKVEKARFRFIEDIRSSKDGCFTWKSNIGFIIDSDILYNCIHYETVTFKLYLYHPRNKKDSSRKIAQKESILIAPKKTALGLEYVEKDEKGHVPKTANPDPKNETAAQLDTHFVPLTNSFESGTTQVFGRMVEDLAAAQQPTLDQMLNEDDEVLLHPETGLGVQTGKAIVITMQNANPKQWMPDYQLPKTCRGDNKEKVTLEVHNPTSTSFKAGDNVMLQKIDGVWIPSFLPLGEAASTVLSPADPKWSFTYLITNSTYFFRNHWWYFDNDLYGPRTGDSNWRNHVKNTPGSYEKSFYRWYYRDEETGSIYKNSDNPEIIDITDNKERYSEEFDKQAQVVNGYFQVTSWDFMGENIGGTRRKGSHQGYSGKDNPVLAEPELPHSDWGWAEITDGNKDQIFNSEYGNALSTTQFSYDTEGNPFEGDGIGGAFNSYPFFGCVFPEGYRGQSHYQVLMDLEKDFFLQPKNMGKVAGLYDNSSAAFFWPTVTPPFLNVNNVKNAGFDQNGRPITHQEVGMFPQGEDGSLKHLPADIALNAGPSGKYGSPITDIGLIGSLNYHLDQSFRLRVADYFSVDEETGQPNRYAWMHKKPQNKANIAMTSGNVGDFDYSWEDYAFDIQPANPLKIEFRPLNLEVYATFEGWQSDGQPNYTYGAVNLDRGAFSEKGYQLLQSYYDSSKQNKPPLISPVALYRNGKQLFNPAVRGAAQNPEEKRLTPLYQDRKPDDPVNQQGLRYNVDLQYEEWDFLPEDLTHAPQSYWDDGWMQNILRPAGGIGIIAAVATVATRDTLQFVVDNALGLDSYLEPGGLLANAQYSRSFRDGDYSTLNTTNLFARVYQQWPRELTIYDPRFFAIHHFNPGVEKSDLNKHPVDFDWYLNGIKVKEEDLSSEDFENTPLIYPSGKFMVDKKEFSVDFRIPTDYDNKPIGSERVGYSVFSDSVDSELKNKGALNSLVKIRKNKNHWRVNPQRRGKLLPYSYKLHTIGINKDKNVYFIDHEDMQEAKVVKISPTAVSIVVVDRGSGYKSKDVFEVEGGEGGGVILVPTIDEEGRISGFDIKDQGTGFRPQDFLSSDTMLEYVGGGSAPAGPLKIVPKELQSEGTGLKAYVLCGQLIETKVVTDEKPKEALSTTGPIKLTASPPLFNRFQLQPQLTEQKNQSFTINEKSQNDEYDIFLFFHNDISHTRIHEYTHSLGPQQIEQMARLEIRTNAGAGSDTANNLGTLQDQGGVNFGFKPGEGADQFAGNDNIINSNNPDGLGGMFGGGDILGGGGLGGGFGF
jgi:hypothetical protein